MKILIRFIFCLFLFGGFLDLVGQVKLNWVEGFGSDQSPVTSSDVALTSDKGVVAIGNFTDTMDFDPGPGIVLRDAGYNDGVYIHKLDSAGNLVWVKILEGHYPNPPSTNQIGEVYANSIHALDNGEMIVAGVFKGTVDLDPDTTVQAVTGPGVEDMFIMKLDSNGNSIWYKVFGNNLTRAHATSITSDGSGNLLVLGQYRGTLDFDPGSGSEWRTSSNPVAFDLNFFTLKLDSQGGFKWVYTLNNNNWGGRVVTDDSNNVYFTGYLGSSIDVDLSPSNTHIVNPNGVDGFVMKLDSAGSFKHIELLSGPGFQTISEIAIDDSMNLYIGGAMRDSADFNFGSGSNYLNPTGLRDIFTAKLRPNLSRIWVSHFEGAGTSYIDNAVVDEGELFFTVRFTHMLDADPGSGVHNLIPYHANAPDDFGVLKLDTAGQLAWVSHYRFGSGGLYGRVDVWKDQIVLAGVWADTADFDPSIGEYIGRVIPVHQDYFISAISECTQDFVSVSETVCYAKRSPSGRYEWASSGTYKDTIPNANGCDSIVTFNLTVNRADTVIQVTECDVFNSPNHVWTTSGIFHDTVASTGTCDSLMTFDLTINYSSSDSVYASACDIYQSQSGNQTWSTSGNYIDTIQNHVGCDSILFVDLTINSSKVSSVSISSCDTVFSPSGNHKWTLGGIYQDTIPTSRGCDSILTISVDVLKSSSFFVRDTSCGPMQSPSGSFTWTTSGTYQDVITNHLGCDSVLTVELTIVDLDNSLTIPGDGSIIANEDSANYQWFECDPDIVDIQGANSKVYYPSHVGLYGVELTRLGCVENSSCWYMSTLNIPDKDQISMTFQNPVSDYLEINGDNLKIGIYTLEGKFLGVFETRNQKIDLSELAPSVYFIKIDGAPPFRVVKL